MGDRLLSVDHWLDAVPMLRASGYGVERLFTGAMPDPARDGARKSVGLPVGQRADYRLLLPSGECLHVRDYGEHYGAHLDAVDPSVSVYGHLWNDAPQILVIGGALVLGAATLAVWRVKAALS